MADGAEFDGKVAVVTGGARGLGKAFATALAERGASVVLVDLDAAELDRAVQQIGPAASAMPGDVADATAMQALMDAIAARHGGIDLLINNAGIHGFAASRFIGEIGLEATRRMFDVNVFGVINCTLAARPHMAGREGASIINLASTASYRADKAYGVTKLAVRGLTISFAHELAGEGIRVNALAPGLTMTDTIKAELPEPLVKMVVGGQIIKRTGEEADVVHAMLYLASPRAGFVTGETLRVGGGSTLAP